MNDKVLTAIQSIGASLTTITRELELSVIEAEKYKALYNSVLGHISTARGLQLTEIGQSSTTDKVRVDVGGTSSISQTINK